MTFTSRDRRRIQVALNLPVTQLADFSELRDRMRRVEEFDLRYNTEIAISIIRNLDGLDEVDGVIREGYLDGSAAAARAAYKVDEYSESLSFGAGNRSLGSGYQERRQHYIQAIRRDLGYGSGAMGGRIPVM